jgi:hypothetical protein
MIIEYDYVIEYTCVNLAPNYKNTFQNNCNLIFLIRNYL